MNKEATTQLKTHMSEIVVLLVNILNCFPITIRNACSVGNLILIFIASIEINNEKWCYIVHHGDLVKKVRIMYNQYG